MSPRRRPAALPWAAAAAAAVLLAPAAASADAGARIVAIRILDADGSRAERPLDRRRTYRYAVHYKVAGAPTLRVGRALTLIGPGGGPVLLVRPPGGAARAGAYTARGTLRLRRDDPTGLYRLRYAVRVREPGSRASAAARTSIRVRFRNPARA